KPLVPPAPCLPLALAEVASDRGGQNMWRAFFWSIGIFACLLGGECLVLEKAVLTQPSPAANNGSPMALRAAPSRQKEIVVPDWAPWSLFSFGAVTLIYTVTIPKRANAG